MKKLLNKKGAFAVFTVLFMVLTILFVWVVASPVSVIGSYKESATDKATGFTVETTIKINSSNKYTQIVKTFDEDGKEVSSKESQSWYFVDQGKLVTLPLLAKDATKEDYKKAVEDAKESLTYEKIYLEISPKAKLGKIYYDEKLSYNNAAIVVVAVILGVLDAVVLVLAILSLLYLLKGNKKTAKKKTAKAKK